MKAKEIFFYSLGALIVLGFFLILGVSIAKGDNPEAVNLCIGTLLAGFGTVVGYYYGSSKGSADKTEMMHSNAKARDNPPEQ